jgi:hypothetical protein
MQLLRIETNGDTFWKGELLGRSLDLVRQLRALGAKSMIPLHGVALLIVDNGERAPDDLDAWRVQWSTPDGITFGIKQDGTIMPCDDPQFLWTQLQRFGEGAQRPETRKLWQKREAELAAKTQDDGSFEVFRFYQSGDVFYRGEHVAKDPELVGVLRCFPSEADPHTTIELCPPPAGADMTVNAFEMGVKGSPVCLIRWDGSLEPADPTAFLKEYKAFMLALAAKLPYPPEAYQQEQPPLE